MDSIKHFRIMISSIMKNRGILQQEFAALVGVSQATVSYWFTGKKEPTLSSILSICYTFEINPNELLGISQYTNK